MRINNFDQSSDSTEIYAAKLAYIGATFATFGHDLQATAAALTSEKFEKAKKTDSIESENVQKQIDYLDDLINKITLFSADVIKTVEPILIGKFQDEGLQEIIKNHLKRNLEHLNRS